MTTYSLYGQAAQTVDGNGVGNAGTIGIHFTASSACTLNGVWLYSVSGQSLTQLPTSIGVWTTQASPSTGTLVTSNTATWLTGPGGSSASAGSGWVYAAFTSPPSLTSGTNYMAGCFRNDATNGWFAYLSTYTWPHSNGILTAPKDTGNGQGWYSTTTTGITFTNIQLAPYNYYVDVQVTTSSHAGAASLTGTGSLTAAGAFGGAASLSGSGTLGAAAHKSVPAAASLSGSGTLTPTGNGRSQYTWPFSYDSIWNLPVSASATYTPSGITVSSDYSTDPSAVEYCCTDPAQPVKSLTNAKLPNGSIGAANVYVYPGMSAPGNWNDCSALLGTDGDTVYQGQTLLLTAGGNPSYGGAADSPSATVSLKGTGITGAHGGSGLSALGGTLTVADLTGTKPIRHAMKLCFNGLLYYSSSGAGYQWPAVSADGGYNNSSDPNYYGGSNAAVVLGALLALPPWVSPYKYLDPLVQRIATAMQCYGAYIVDNTASGPGVSNALIELNYDATSYFTGTSTFSSDFHQLLMDLQVVTNSTSSTPGGGSIGSSRFAPYAPPFNDGTGAPPSLTVVSPFSLLMESLQDSFPGTSLSSQWGSYGTVAVSGNQCGIASGTSESGIYSASGYTLTGNYMLARVTPYTGGTGPYTYFQAVTKTGSGGAGIQYNSGSLWAYWISSGGTVTNLSSITYDPSAHAWWRIREASGTTYFDTSPDGGTWVNRWSVANPVSYASMGAQCGTAIGSGTAGTSYLSSFNLPFMPGAAALSGSGTLNPVATPQFYAPAVPGLAVPGSMVPGTPLPQTTGAAPLSGTGTLGAAWVLAGSASLSGTGTLGAAAHKAVPGSVALSGSGTFTASGGLAGSAALSGSGTLGATGHKTVPGAASLSGTGTVTAAWAFAGSVALTGTGTLAAAGQKTVPGAAALSGTGTFTAPGSKTVPGAASLSGAGTFTAAGSKTVPGAAALSGTGAFTASAAKTVPGAAALSGAGTLTPFGFKTVPGAASLSGTGTLGATGFKTVPGAAALAGAGTLAASGIRQLPGAAALGGEGTLAAAASKTVPGAAALSGAGTFGAAGFKQVPGAAALSGTGTLGATAQKSVPGAAALSGTGTVSAAAAVSFPSSAALSGEGTFGAVSGGFIASSAALSGQGTFTASGFKQAPGAAVLSGAGTLTAAGLAAYARSAALSGSGTLSAAASKQVPGAGALSGTGTLGAASSTVHARAAALSGSGTLTTAFLVTVPGSAALSGAGTLAAAGSKTVPGAAPLSGSGALLAAGTRVLPGAAHLSGTGSISGAPIGFVPGAASLSGSGTLGAASFRTVRALAALTAPGHLSAPAAVVKLGAAHLSAPGSLLATGIIPQRGAAALSAHPVLFASAFNRLGTASLAAEVQMACTATAGPDLDALWGSYQGLKLAAQQQWDSYRMMHQAGATDGTAGFMYIQAYEAERQADIAYQAYLDARKRVTAGVTG